MHTTVAIATFVLVTLAPFAVRAQNPPVPAASANPQPAAAALTPVTVLRADTISLTALYERVLDLERRRPDPSVEKFKWFALAAIGIAFSIAWFLVRRTEKEERAETTLREVMKELSKNPAGHAELEKSLEEVVTKFKKAAGQITEVGNRADAALGLINTRLSYTSERMIEIQGELDRRAHARAVKPE